MKTTSLIFSFKCIVLYEQLNNPFTQFKESNLVGIICKHFLLLDILHILECLAHIIKNSIDFASLTTRSWKLVKCCTMCYGHLVKQLLCVGFNSFQIRFYKHTQLTNTKKVLFYLKYFVFYELMHSSTPSFTEEQMLFLLEQPVVILTFLEQFCSYITQFLRSGRLFKMAIYQSFAMPLVMPQPGF